MSLKTNLAKYIEEKTSYVIDTTIFICIDQVDTPEKCIIVDESPGSFRNFSGLESRAIQISCKDNNDLSAETLAHEINELFSNKPGFDSIHLADEHILFSDGAVMPMKLGRMANGSYIYVLNFTLQKK